MAGANRTLCGIYQIRNLGNGKAYIGSSVDIKSRWRAHISRLRLGNHHSAALQRAWNKYGVDAFEFTVMELVEPTSLLVREQFYIDTMETAKGRLGYNCSPTAGSPLGVKPSAETRKRMSEAQRKIPIEVRLQYCRSWVGRRHTEDTRALMSKNSRRASPTAEQRAAISLAHKGKTISDAHKAISAETCRKRNATPEHRAKVSATNKGRQLTDECKAKLSAAAKGRKVSEATKEKIRATLQRRTFSPEHRAKIKASIAANKLKSSQTV